MGVWVEMGQGVSRRWCDLADISDRQTGWVWGRLSPSQAKVISKKYVENRGAFARPPDIFCCKSPSGDSKPNISSECTEILRKNTWVQTFFVLGTHVAQTCCGSSGWAPALHKPRSNLLFASLGFRSWHCVGWNFVH